MLKHRGIDGCRCLQGLLQGLPASHPAVIWTTGSVRTTHTSTTRQCNMVAVSKFHHRSIHNIQHTLPSFRRPTGISLYQYVSLRDLLQKSGTKESLVGDVSKDSAKALTLAPLRLIHSEKQQSKQRPFVLSPQGIVAASPTVVQPYLRLVRLDRPIGTWLLFLPCAFSLSLSAPAGCLPDPWLLGLFGLGSLLMRGAGCTINDMWDKDFDAKVARTKDRPLACGEISYFQALVFLGAQLSGALAILLTFNWYTIGLGVSSLALCVTYPLMKRFTYWPQAFLGLTLNYGVLISWSAVHGSVTLAGLLLFLAATTHTVFYDTVYSHQTLLFVKRSFCDRIDHHVDMPSLICPGGITARLLRVVSTGFILGVYAVGLTFNWGCLMGWSATTGQCAWECVAPLYAACLAWTLVYDTIYAHQDKEDDILVGVKSTALRFGDSTKQWLTGFTGVVSASLTATGMLCSQTWPYFLGVGLFTGHLGRQIYTVDLNNPDDCGAKFRSNRNLGILFWLSIMAGNLLKEEEEDKEGTAKTEEGSGTVLV